MNGYDSHNFLSFSIRLNTDLFTSTLWSWISKQYEAFLCSATAHPNLEFHVGPFLPELTNCYIWTTTATYARIVYTTADYKFARFEYDIGGWESGAFKVRIPCNPPGFLMVSGLIINPLLLFYALIREQVM